ncbi:MAG: PilZ domain-containing protein [Gammaproteobacteria bacterium]|jgi:hypothetical protein|nr:PilZ domain-containing protein [Gammaproteobacteria bacterium]
MNGNDATSFGTGLCYEDVLPLRWRRSDDAHSLARSLAINLGNEQLLRHLAAVDEFRGEGGEDDSQTAHDLHRLESKLDLLIDLIGELLTRQADLPVAAPVRLCAETLVWTCAPGAAPATGDFIEADVFLSPRYPRPLVIFGVIESVQAEDDGRARVSLRYRELSAGVRSALEKTIFRQHRRMVAQARQGSRR